MILHNPQLGGEPGPLRDPMIVFEEGRYYMVATSPPFWKGANPGVMLWSSADLAGWKREGLLVDAAALPADSPCKDRFWAPELFGYGGKWYLTFSARNESQGASFGMFLAVADRITGPYTLFQRPFVTGDYIDAHLQQDTNGKIYIFYSNKDIFLQEFDLETAAVRGERQLLLAHGREEDWDAVGIEGPFVVRRDGRYILWYSSWTRSYEMGWAMADSLTGPYRKWRANPVISGYGSPIDYAGHNCAFRLPDGRDAIAYHGVAEGTGERLCIQAVDYPMASVRTAPCVEIIQKT